MTLKDITLRDGTFVPKDTLITAATWATHRDEALYPDADVFDPFLVRLLTFPSMSSPSPSLHKADSLPFAVPTIAAINGHCFAAGLITSLACDYRIMTDGSKRNAWMCMNESTSSLVLLHMLSS